MSSSSKRRHRSPIILPIIYLFNMCHTFLRCRGEGMCSSASSRRLYYSHNNGVRWGYKHFTGQTCPSLFTDSIQSAEVADHHRHHRLMRSVTLRRASLPSLLPLFSPLQYAHLTYFHDPITFHIEVRERQSDILGRHPGRAQRGGCSGR